MIRAFCADSRMKKNTCHWAAAALGVAAAFAFTSCAYDPNYATVGGSGYVGYGEGYGYGGSNFNTSVFVSTGDPQWGYDPYCYSYYDYYRHCYYDPYLYGYYPVGYRPAVVIGVPHPYGWRPGYGHCPPPRIVRTGMVVNYHNREYAYQHSNYKWAKQVRMAPGSHTRGQSQTINQNPHNRYKDGSPPPSGNYRSKDRSAGQYPQGANPNTHGRNDNKYGPAHNKPTPDYSSRKINTPQPGYRQPGQGNPPAQFNPQAGSRGGNMRTPPPSSRGNTQPPPSRGGGSAPKENKHKKPGQG